MKKKHEVSAIIALTAIVLLICMIFIVYEAATGQLGIHYSDIEQLKQLNYSDIKQLIMECLPAVLVIGVQCILTEVLIRKFR